MRYKDLKIVENAQPGDELCAGIIRLKNKEKNMSAESFKMFYGDSWKRLEHNIKRYLQQFPDPAVAAKIKKCWLASGQGEFGSGNKVIGTKNGTKGGTATTGTKNGTKGGTATTGTKNGTKGGTATTGTKDGTATTGTKDGTGTKGSSTAQTINDKFGTEMQTFGEFLDSNDLEGALAFLDGNPGFEKAIGSKFRTDIQSALDAQEAKERNRLAQEKADKEAEEAQRIADEKAAKEAKEKADAAAEAKRIADAEEQKRLDAIEAERKAAEAKKAKDEADAKAERERQQAEVDRLEKEAEQARIAAEKLEQERIEAEAEAQRIADEEEEAENLKKPKNDSPKTDDNSGDIEEFNWEDLQ
jgi:flagellar biosynthesis GTPase FlhF